MEKITSEWNGFRSEIFEFNGQKATVIFPENSLKEKKWLFKTEYLDAFPSFELEMLKRGYFVANIENETRWGAENDTRRQIEFAKLLQKEYGFNEKCIPVGMSCGGMQAVYIAAKAPQLIAGLYLDAPVMNLLSCPCGIGKAKDTLGAGYREYVEATGGSVSELINYRNHPIDCADALIENSIPVFLVCGDSDEVVPYEENGKILYEKYLDSGRDITLVLKPGCNHHPHGLPDNSQLIDFAGRVY